MADQGILNQSLEGVSNYLTIGSIKLTEWINSLLSKIGIQASVRFSNLIVVFLALILIYIGMQITKPIIKFLLWVIGIIIIVGSLFPVW
jgi:hypothetical protein